jgi:hypothetical protein
MSIDLRGRSVSFYDDISSFPTIGSLKTLYVDRGSMQIYAWDGATYELIDNGGGGGSSITVVANYAALPPANTVTGQFYWCSASQGTRWLPGSLGGTYYPNGLYYSNGTSWEFVVSPYQATQAEVDTGTNDDKFITPKTFNDSAQLSGKVPYTGATSDVDLGEFELKAGQVELDQTPTGTAGVAVMRWNDTDGTIDLGLKGGNVTLQVGQEQVLRVVNKTATNVNLLEANYQAVRVTGAQGQRLKVDLAQATTDALSAETIGLVTETINNNQEGFITTSGIVRNINTTGSLQSETWVDGDVVYLSPTTAGNITNIKPSAPNHLIIIGYVVSAHATQGSIFVKVDNGYELDELHNVAISSPANNDALVYESSSLLWKNKPILSSLGWFKTTVTTNYTVTGTTSETIASSTQLATLSNGTIFKINTLRITKGAVAGSTIRAYISPNSNNLSGAVQILSTGSTIVTGTRLATISRVFEIEGGNIKGLNAATGVINDNGTSTVVGLDAALPSGTLYLIVTFTNSAVGESTTQELLDISNF